AALHRRTMSNHVAAWVLPLVRPASQHLLETVFFQNARNRLGHLESIASGQLDRLLCGCQRRLAILIPVAVAHVGQVRTGQTTELPAELIDLFHPEFKADFHSRISRGFVLPYVSILA